MNISTPELLAIEVMLTARLNVDTKNAQREDVEAALARLDGARAWITSRWPQFAKPVA